MTKMQKRLRKRESKETKHANKNKKQGGYEERGQARHTPQRILNWISKAVWQEILIYLELKDISALTRTCQDFQFCSLSVTQKDGKDPNIGMAFKRPSLGLMKHCKTSKFFKNVKKAHIMRFSHLSIMNVFCKTNFLTLEHLNFKISISQKNASVAATMLSNILISCQNLKSLVIQIYGRHDSPMAGINVKHDMKEDLSTPTQLKFPNLTLLSLYFPSMLRGQLADQILLNFLNVCPNLRDLSLAGKLYENPELKYLGKFCPALSYLDIDRLVLYDDIDQPEEWTLCGDLLKELRYLTVNQLLVHWTSSQGHFVPECVPPVTDFTVNLEAFTDSMVFDELSENVCPGCHQMMKNIKTCTIIDEDEDDRLEDEFSVNGDLSVEFFWSLESVESMFLDQIPFTLEWAQSDFWNHLCAFYTGILHCKFLPKLLKVEFSTHALPKNEKEKEDMFNSLLRFQEVRKFQVTFTFPCDPKLNCALCMGGQPPIPPLL